VAELCGCDATFLCKRTQQQWLQAGHHDAADADRENDAEL
jgi:hypothetical protein